MVLTNVESTPVRVHELEDWRVLTLDGKPSAPNLSPSQAVSLTRLDMYRPVFMR